MENKLKIKNLKFKINIWPIIFLGIGILTIFSFLRLFHLTILPIFADEAIYIRWSQVMRAEPTLRFLPLSDGKQPLFMWLTIPFLKIFSDPLAAGRFLSVLAGLGSLIGIFFLTREISKNKWVSLAASFLYVVVPFFVFFDRLALVDSMLMMFGIWIAYLGILLTRYRRWDLAMITGMVLGGALLTKSPAVFFAILLPFSLILIINKLPHVRNFVKRGIEIVPLWGVVYLFGFGIYNFLLRLGPGFQMITLRNKDYVFSLKEILSHPLDPLKPHLGDLANWLPNLLTWPVFLFGLIGIFIGLRRKLKETLFLLAWFIVPLFIQSVFAKVFTPRYILFTIWPLVIFASFSLSWLFNQLNQLKRRLTITTLQCVVIVGLLIIALPALRYDWLLLTNPEKAPLPRNLRSGHLEEWTAGQGIREIADFVKEKAQTSNVLVGTEGFFGTLPDGLQIYLERVPKVTVIGVGYPITNVHQGLINSLQDNEVYLVVNQSRLRISPQTYGLKLIKEYPKATAPDGGQDKLLLFELDKDYW